SLPFSIAAAGEEKTLTFQVTPPANEAREVMTAVATVNGREITQGTRVIQYPHIPPQTLAPLAKATLVRINAKNLSKKVGYIMGAGDEVPDALTQMGCDVTLLSETDITTGN